MGLAWTGERWPERRDQPGGENAPRPVKRMETLAKVVSQLHKQWGIDCRPKELISAITRLLQIGAIDRPVDILHSDVWDRCTKALAEDTMSSGSGKYLKSWGKVVQALRTALQEQETWKAAQDCLLATPKLGVGATTQTLVGNLLSEPSSSQERGDLLSPPCPSSPIPESPPVEQQKSLWDDLLDKVRNLAVNLELGAAWDRSPLYAPQSGAGQRTEGQGPDAMGGQERGPSSAAS